MALGTSWMLGSLAPGVGSHAELWLNLRYRPPPTGQCWGQLQHGVGMDAGLPGISRGRVNGAPNLP